MIRVEVREEHAREPGQRKIRQIDPLPGARAGVHQEELPAGEYGRAGARAGRVGQRGARAAEHDVKTGLVRQPRLGAREVALDLGVHEALAAERATEQECR